MSKKNGKISDHLTPPAIAWGDEAEGQGDETEDPEGDITTIEERIRDFGRYILALREAIQKAGIEDEENVTALIINFFDQETMR